MWCFSRRDSKVDQDSSAVLSKLSFVWSNTSELSVGTCPEAIANYRWRKQLSLPCESSYSSNPAPASASFPAVLSNIASIWQNLRQQPQNFQPSLKSVKCGVFFCIGSSVAYSLCYSSNRPNCKFHATVTVHSLRKVGCIKRGEKHTKKTRFAVVNSGQVVWFFKIWLLRWNWEDRFSWAKYSNNRTWDIA